MERVKLLLVDDELDFREATARALRKRDYEVTAVPDGESALEAIARDRPDAMVLDLRMEGMGGIETLRRLRQGDQALPVLNLTGHGTFEDAVAGIQLGIHDFLQKPVDIDRLSARIRRLLARGETRVSRERSIRELMVPIASYARVSVDTPLRVAAEMLRDSVFKGMSGKVVEQGHRSLLVFDGSRFVGVFRVNDLLSLMIPEPLKGSPYASFLTGMFLAQTKLIGDQRVGDQLRPLVSVDVEAPLMEAVNTIVTERLINLPVLEDGELVGVLRDKDLLLEIAGASG